MLEEMYLLAGYGEEVEEGDYGTGEEGGVVGFWGVCRCSPITISFPRTGCLSGMIGGMYSKQSFI